MKVIDKYNVLTSRAKREPRCSYHMPGGPKFRNQFVNMTAGDVYGTILSQDELLVICHDGAFTFEPTDDDKVLIWTLGAEGGNKKSEGVIELAEHDQLVVSAQCRLKISCVKAGTIQFVGFPDLLPPSDKP